MEKLMSSISPSNETKNTRNNTEELKETLKQFVVILRAGYSPGRTLIKQAEKLLEESDETK